jgi:hypothetical protein
MTLDVRSLAIVVLALGGITLITLVAHIRSSHQPTLWESELIPDSRSIPRLTKRLCVAFETYRENFGLSRLVLEMANESRIESEFMVYILVMIAYVYVLMYYIRINPPHPEVSIDVVGVFLSTFGVVVVLGIVATYLYFFRAFSDYYARWHLRQENNFARRRIKYLLESLDSGRSRSKTPVIRAKAELHGVITRLNELDELLLGTNAKIRLTTILGLVGSVSALLQLLAFITGNLIRLNVFSQWYMFLIVSYSFAALMLLFTLPVVRARHLLKWCQMDDAASELRNSVKELGVAYLGKTRTDLLIRNFHLSWKPSNDYT